MPDPNPKLLKRPTFAYKIPDNARVFPEDDIKSFKIRPYTLAEEIDAAKAAALSGGSETAMKAELVRRSVIDVNGAAPTDLDWVDRQSPAVRDLLNVALTLCQGAKQEDLKVFLDSQEVTQE